jgi:alginate O-acetyltransferase complex protein AlgI
MLFNSAAFAIFFPVVTALYFLTPDRWRWALLLVASCVFYMAFIPAYLAILALLIAIDYTAGIWIEKSEGRWRSFLLTVSIVANVGFLAAFKYYDFFAANLADAAARFGVSAALPLLRVALPIGLSFHTFQAMAYTIGVYRREVPAERHLGIYALYVMFYPQLVAGPIERPGNLIPQLRAPHRFDPDRVANGLRLMAWGLFKKVAIADRLALVVNPVYASPAAYSGRALAAATFFFAWQIYCDFSGYSDIAIGAAEVMGYDLMVNFRRPYLAESIRDFWHRWHISLSTWFRDYVYIPLGGNRAAAASWVAVVLVTFMLSGFWHGANWTFIAWGALNGLYLVVGKATAGLRARLRQAIGLSATPSLERAVAVVSTFSLICVSWVLFRAATLRDAGLILSRMFDWRPSELMPLPMLTTSFAIAVTLIAVLAAIEFAGPAADPRPLVVERSAWIRWPAYYALLIGILVLGIFNQSRFIYFQF